MSADTSMWRTTITMLLLNFRSALIAILPYMDAIKIGWKDDEAYDDWDDIASSLYRNMVMNSIRHSSECRYDLELAPYDLLVSSYKRMYITVIYKQFDKLAFIGFSSKSEAFDSVKCVPIQAGKVNNAIEEILYFPVSECQFELVLEDDNEVKISEITVEI